MQTQVMPGPGVGAAACLEYEALDGSGLQRVPVDTDHFLIGRAETAGLQLDSVRVSREHAVVTRVAGRYSVEDLGSTNGTFVNGQRIEKAALSDGDVLMVADVELSFTDAPPGAVRDTVTQVLASSKRGAKKPDAKGATLPQLIRDVRQLHEAMVQGVFDVPFVPIVSLDDGHVLGYEALGEDRDAGPHSATASSSLLETTTRYSRSASTNFASPALFVRRITSTSS